MNLRETVSKILNEEVSETYAKRFANYQFGTLCAYIRSGADIKDKLKELIECSNIESEFMREKAIKINVFGDAEYVEMVILNNELTFLDNNGLHHSPNTLSLDDLIDIYHYYS